MGDPYAIRVERDPAHTRYSILRSVEWSGERLTHQGADLGRGRAGDTVRAAAAGIVARVAAGGADAGYGTHIVLAHRLPGGAVAYSVYAHLLTGSASVRAGDIVQAGAALARVGQSGRASTPHLHFEVRLPRDPSARWEHARVTDPLEFVLQRLPAQRADTSAVRPYLEWAENAGLLSFGARGEDALTREAWWRMLANAAVLAGFEPPARAAALRDSLVELGLLPQKDSRRDTDDRENWKTIERDLERLRHTGLRVGSGPLLAKSHQAFCRERFGSSKPSAGGGALRERSGSPTMADACVLLADVAGPRNAAHASPRRASKKAVTHPAKKAPRSPRA